jgi:hypothetical protein
MTNFTTEHGPFMLQYFWVLAVVEMVAEASFIKWVSSSIGRR